MRGMGWMLMAANAALAQAPQAPAANPAEAPALLWRYGPVTQPPLPVGQHYRDWNAAWAGGHGYLPQLPDGRYAAGGAAVYGAQRPATASPDFAPALVLSPSANLPYAAPRPNAPAPRPAPPAVAEAKPAAPPPAPFQAVARAVPDAGKWTEYDISDYVGRFDPADHAEAGVKRWLLATTGNVWNEGELASLSVTPERVKVRHTPEVQRQVAATLGRFLYFTPGEYRCRIRVVQTGSAWRRSFADALAAAPNVRGGQGWQMPQRLVEELLDETATGPGNVLLWEQAFNAPNGQRTIVEMSSDAARGRQGGVALRFSPLIREDGVDIEFEAHGRKAAAEARSDEPDEWQARAEGLAKLPAGHALVMSLGKGPGLDQRVRLLNPRPETLLILELAPERGSKLAGRPLAVETAPRPERSERAERPAYDLDAAPGTRRSLSPRKREERVYNDLFDWGWR